MQLTLFIFITFHFVSLAKCEFQAFVVNGIKANTSMFPHAAFIAAACKEEKEINPLVWICGSSILNQNMILTAGHCLVGCSSPLSITVSVGNVNIAKATKFLVQTAVLHDKYDDEALSNDIALLKLKSQLIFNSNVKRVVLMKKPPYREEAMAAGWGFIDEIMQEQTKNLMFIKQYVWQKNKCLQLFNEMPHGTFCATSRKKSSYMSHGDSGSALLVRGYIQIGLVSYKEPEISRNVIIYTDVGSYYDWIKNVVNKLMCESL